MEMEKPTILYDAKCSICKNLAYKIHFNDEQTIDIVALSDPESHRILKRFYPNGWKHDFYVVANGTCRKGLWALPQLVGAIGSKRVGAAMAEYASFKLSLKKCGADHENTETNGDGNNGHSRGDFLKYAALSPAALVFTKMPKLDDPLSEPPQEFTVNVAEVRPAGASGRYVSKAYRCDDCVRTTENSKDDKPQSEILNRKEKVLRDISVTPSANGKSVSHANDKVSAALKIRHSTVEGKRVENGAPVQRKMTVHSAVIDHDRYNISINVGKGPVESEGVTKEASTMSGMIGYDLPVPIADFIVYKGDEGDDATSHIGAYLAGVQELRKLHRKEGRTRLVSLYKEIEDGLVELKTNYEQSVTEQFEPIKNQVIITSMPEVLKFVESPQQDISVQGGCTCSCGCGCCCSCGCGCSCGLCGCSCGCGCCCDCGCGCSCGCCL